MSERYIVIPSWDRYQHYKDQTRPPWIKLYTHLLHDDEFLRLTEGQRSALFGIWLLYAESGCQLRANTASLTRQLSQRVTSRTLETLNQAGFIEFRSRAALDKLYAQKKRIEKKVSTPLSVAKDAGERKSSKKQNGRGEGWVENLGSYTGCRYVRGEHAVSAVYDPLGRERPPADWPHERPKPAEIKRALKERANA